MVIPVALALLLPGCGGGVAVGGGPAGGDAAPVDSSPPDSGDTDPETLPDTDDPDPPDDTAPPDEPTPDLLVDCAGGGDHVTIAAAVAAARSGTRIGLAPCTYAEAIDFRGKTLDIYGVAPRAQVVVEAPAGAPAVTAQRGESVGTRLAHVTLRGGGGASGAALAQAASILTLEDVHITGIGRTSALLYGEGSGLTLLDVTIEGNSYARGGYLASFDNGWLVAQRLDAACDGAQYGIVQHEAMLLLDSTLACDGADVALYVSGGELHARRSDIVGGTYGVYGEDNDDTRNERLWMYNTSVVADDTAVAVSYMNLRLRNAVLLGGRVGLDLTAGYAESFLYASFFGGARCPVAGDGGTYAQGWNALDGEPCRIAMPDALIGEPGFVAAPDDLHLAAGSPLLDAGDPDEDHADDDGTRNDIGRYGGPEADGPR